MSGLFDTIGGILGINGNNNNFKAQQANITPGTDASQIGNAYSNALPGIGNLGTLANNLASQGTAGQNSQDALTAALTNQMNGGGPNPAQAQLNQNTGNNIASQAALMAGQRGVGANPGLIARQIGQQGAGIQQNAVGQAATLQAQQQLAAQQQLQNLAGTQIGQQQNALTGYNQAAQGEQGILQGALANQNNAAVSSQNNANSTNAGVANNNANTSAGALGSGLNAIGSVFGLPGLFSSGSSSKASGLASPSPATTGAQFASGGEVNPKSDQVPQSDRMSLQYYPQHIQDMAHLYHSDAMMKDGGVVPGKAKVEGDSLKNDVVPAKLSPGEVVIPRSVMESKNPGEAAKAFVEKLHGKYSEDGDEEGDFKSALKRAISTRKSK